MKISLTPEQYQDLIRLAYAWNFLINWNRRGKHIVSEINELAFYIYSQTWPYFVDELFTIDDDLNHLPKDKKLLEYLSYYVWKEEERFYFNLCDKLIERDSKDKNLSPKEYKKLVDSYIYDFKKNWIKNLKLVNE